MSEAHVVVYAHVGAHAHRRGCHRAPLFHRGRHRAPVAIPIPQRGRYALVVGAAVLGAGAVALGSAALPDVDGAAAGSITAEDHTADDAAAIPRYRSDPGPPAAHSRNEARADRPSSPITEQPAEEYWRAPLDRFTLTSLFGYRWGMRHEGLDFAAPPGAPVYAAGSGIVKSAGWNHGGFGQLVVVDHGDGVLSYYAHNSAILVAEGQEVQAGQQIAAVGNTGNSLGPHCHFELHVDGEPVDPLPFLTERGVDVRGLAAQVLADEKPLH